MKINPKLFVVFTTILLAIFGTLFGMGLGFFLYGSLVPLWTSREIQPLQGAKDIVQVDIRSMRNDPTQDTLYVVAQDGQIFSNTLFQSNWQPVKAVPQPGAPLTTCSDGRQAYLPAESGIVRSVGFQFEHTLSTTVRCYILLDDGRLQVWTRSTDMFKLLTAIMLGGAAGLVGGSLLNALFWRIIQARQERTNRENFLRRKRSR